MCYTLLGLGVPVHHWAFQKYPHLLDELGSESDGTVL